MRKWILIMLLLPLLCLTVQAEEGTDIDTGSLLEGLSEDARELLPEVSPAEQSDLWSGVKEVLRRVLDKTGTPMQDAVRLCAVLLCIVTLCAVVELPNAKNGSLILNAAGAVGLCAAMTGTFGSMIATASETVQEMSSYNACLLPVMASACAMSGGLSSATALYSGTLLFSQLLLRLITKLLIPAVYFFLAVSTAEAALGSEMLSELRELIAWLISKSLRILLYAFIAYLTLTGVISGTTDAAAVKATKAAVSSMIPVVGSILSDASETLLASASLVKNAAGVFGMLAVLAICLLPVLTTGIHYLMLKLTAAVSGAVGQKPQVNLLKHFSQAMGFLLAMCGTGGLLSLISTVCFMKAVGI